MIDNELIGWNVALTTIFVIRNSYFVYPWVQVKF
jgi:hypothetical protein